LDDFSPESAALVNAACDRFEDAWRAGKRPPIKDYLPTSLPEDRKAVLVQELVVLDVFFGSVPAKARGPTSTSPSSRAWINRG
jgi:hypothetical protein